MNFALLNKVVRNKKEEFDIKEYLDKTDIFTNQIDSYFINEPIKLIESMEKFDKANDFQVIEVETSLLNMIQKGL